MKQEDREALHSLLDAVIDKIEDSRDVHGYVAFDISSYSYGVRASADGRSGWLMYRDFYKTSDYCSAKRSNQMAVELAGVEFSATKQETSTTEDE